MSQTKLPELRFVNDGNYRICKLSEVSSYAKGTIILPKNKYVSTENIRQNFLGIIPYDSSEQTKGTKFQKGDILFANIRPYLKKVVLADCDGCCSSDVLVIRPVIKLVLPKYLYYSIANDSFIAYVMEGAKGSKMPRGDKTFIMNAQIGIPSLKEQSRLIDFFEKIDKKITYASDSLEHLDNLRKNIVSELIARKNSSFKEIRLSNVLTERKEKNIKSDCEICSVAVEDGVVNQIKHLGRSFAAKNVSNYKVVHLGDVVYTKSPTGLFPFGIIKQSFIEHRVAVSPLYAIYKPKSFEAGLFLHFYFLSVSSTNDYLRPLISKGAKNTMNITNDRAIQGTIMFPLSEDELKKQAKLFALLDEKYHALKDELESLYSLKTEFMAKTFLSKKKDEEEKE